MSATFDFQARQESARRASALFVLLFLLMAGAISLGIGFVAGLALSGDEFAPPGTLVVDPDIVAVVAVLTMLVILVVAFVRILTFGGDGAKVALSLGAEEVTDDTANPYKKRYLNVVEEMAIAAGLPRPRVFVLKHEQGINAFAAGADPDRAAVAVTHGALSKLNREELSGVVAHEMAHIANYDTRLYVRLMGMVFGLVVLYTLGRVVLRSFFYMRGGRRDDKGSAPAIAIGLALVILGLLGVLGGRILQSAVSRRREYLADATGVQFTRNPHGLANALKKIGGTKAGSHIDNGHAEEARHMFFAQASGSLGGLFATHPPLVARIRALEPDFDPERDPVWRKDDRQVMRETYGELSAELGLGPWGQSE